MADNDNRCWPGYEPVPGKKPHSQGSCKPKAESKSTSSEKDFRAKRRKQLDERKAKHPSSRPQSAQHLSAPAGTAPARKKAAATKKRAPAKKSAPSVTKESTGKRAATTKRAATKRAPSKARAAKKSAARKRA